MSGVSYKRDLTVLAADQMIEGVVRALLARPEALGMRRVTAELYSHPQRDPGCRTRSDSFLSQYASLSRHALVVFDREGCGDERSPREAIEADVEERLRASGWDNRAAVIVIDPELEQWVWSNSPHVDTILGWKDHNPCLRTWLSETGRLPSGQMKPLGPKESMQSAARLVRTPWSSSLHRDIARKVSFERCVDGAFLKLRSVLQSWFPVE